MDCHSYQDLFTEFLSNSLDSVRQQALENHLANCPSCRQEFEISKKLWNLMGDVAQPAPSGTMQIGFNAILQNFKEEQVLHKNLFSAWIRKMQEYWRFQGRPQFAYSFVILIVGLISGYFLNRPNHTLLSNNRQIDSLTIQVSEMKQTMMLALLENPSASQRIRAVGYTEEINKVDNQVIEALLTTLNEDPNVNVRLITLEALVKFSNQPKVREGLVHSLTLQESPLMQSAIADVMVKLQEKRSVKSMQKLLGKKDLNKLVKLKIEQSIHKLI